MPDILDQIIAEELSQSPRPAQPQIGGGGDILDQIIGEELSRPMTADFAGAPLDLSPGQVAGLPGAPAPYDPRVTPAPRTTPGSLANALWLGARNYPPRAAADAGRLLESATTDILGGGATGRLAGLMGRGVDAYSAGDPNVLLRGGGPTEQAIRGQAGQIAQGALGPVLNPVRASAGQYADRFGQMSEMLDATIPERAKEPYTPEWFAYNIGSTVPQMMQSIGGAAVGTAVGGPVGGFIGAAAPSFIAEGGGEAQSIYQRRLQQGATREQALADAFLPSVIVGAANAGVEIAGPEGQAVRKLLGKEIGGSVRQILRSGVQEGLEEGIQGTISQAGETAATGEAPSLEEFIDQRLQEMAVGSAAGGAAGTAVRLIPGTRGSERQQPPAQSPPHQQTPQQPAGPVPQGAQTQEQAAQQGETQVGTGVSQADQGTQNQPQAAPMTRPELIRHALVAARKYVESDQLAPDAALEVAQRVADKFGNDAGVMRQEDVEAAVGAEISAAVQQAQTAQQAAPPFGSSTGVSAVRTPEGQTTIAGPEATTDQSETPGTRSTVPSPTPYSELRQQYKARFGKFPRPGTSRVKIEEALSAPSEVSTATTAQVESTAAEPSPSGSASQSSPDSTPSLHTMTDGKIRKEAKKRGLNPKGRTAEVRDRVVLDEMRKAIEAAGMELVQRRLMTPEEANAATDVTGDQSLVEVEGDPQGRVVLVRPKAADHRDSTEDIGETRRRGNGASSQTGESLAQAVPQESSSITAPNLQTTTPSQSGRESEHSAYPSPNPSPSAREPWEMTREEYRQRDPRMMSATKRRDEAMGAIGGGRWGETRRFEGRRAGTRIERSDRAQEAWSKAYEAADQKHRAAVEQAIREGKIDSHPDYPDLAAKYQSSINPSETDRSESAAKSPEKPDGSVVKPDLTPGVKPDIGTSADDTPKWGIYRVQTSQGEMFAVRQSAKKGGFGDILHKTEAEARQYAKDEQERQARNAAFHEKENAARAEKDAKDAALKAEREELDGFTDGMPAFPKARAVKVLNSLATVGGSTTYLKSHIRGMVKAGNVTLETSEEPKIKPMSRTAFNRASQREQDAHERKMKEAGTKTVYRVNGYDLGKIAYDYAKFLNEQSKSEAQTLSDSEILRRLQSVEDKANGKGYEPLAESATDPLIQAGLIRRKSGKFSLTDAGRSRFNDLRLEARSRGLREAAEADERNEREQDRRRAELDKLPPPKVGDTLAGEDTTWIVDRVSDNPDKPGTWIIGASQFGDRTTRRTLRWPLNADDYTVVESAVPAPAEAAATKSGGGQTGAQGNVYGAGKDILRGGLAAGERMTRAKKIHDASDDPAVKAEALAVWNGINDGSLSPERADARLDAIEQTPNRKAPDEEAEGRTQAASLLNNKSDETNPGSAEVETGDSRLTAAEFRRQLESVSKSKDEADAIYALVEARAESAGESVDEYVGKRIAGIRNSSSAPEGALEQGTLNTDTPAFRAWFKDSKVVGPDGKPLVVYHGTNQGGFEVFEPTRPTDVVKVDGEEVRVLNYYDHEYDASTDWRKVDPEAYHFGALADISVFGDAQKSLEFRERTERSFDADKHSGDARHRQDLRRLIGKKIERSTEPRPTGDGSYFATNTGYNFIDRSNAVYPVYLSIKNPIRLNASEIEGAGWSKKVEKYKAQGYDGAIFSDDPADIRKGGWSGHAQIVAFSPTQIKSVNNRGTWDGSSPNILHQAAFHGSPHTFDKSGDAANLERLDDALRPDAEAIRDLAQSEPFRTKGLRSFDVPFQDASLARVYRLAQNRKVFEAIVRAIPVDVMNVLVGAKLSPEVLLHDPSVFADLLSIDRDNPISLLVDESRTPSRDVAGRGAVGGVPGTGAARESRTTDRARSTNAAASGKVVAPGAAKLDLPVAARMKLRDGLVTAATKALGHDGSVVQSGVFDKENVEKPDAKVIAEVDSRYRNDPGFNEWLRDLADDDAEYKAALADDKLRREYLEDYLNETHQLKVRDDGLFEFDTLNQEVADIIGDHPVVVYHHTSSKILPKIRKEGLVKGGKNTNRTMGERAAGVYVTTEAGDYSPPVRGYKERARQIHGGEPVTLEIRTTLAELVEDPDDADIKSGRRQFVLPHVPPDRIIFPENNRLEQAKKGAIEFQRDGRAIIHAFESSDVSTMAHELGHLFRRDLASEDLAVAEKWAGAEGGKWSRDAEEKFARGFERYLRSGLAPNLKLKAVFAKFKEWLSRIYATIKGSPIDVKIPEAMTRVYDRLLVPKETRQTATAKPASQPENAVSGGVASQSRDSDLSAMSFKDLQARARELGVSDHGTKKMIVDRIKHAEMMEKAANLRKNPPKHEPTDTIAGTMTLDEFEAKGYSPDEVTRAEWVEMQRKARRALGQSEEDGTANAPYAAYEEYHRDAVKRAVAAGEEVDDRVLADYPELVATTPATTTQDQQDAGVTENESGRDQGATTTRVEDIPLGSGSGTSDVAKRSASAKGSATKSEQKQREYRIKRIAREEELRATDSFKAQIKEAIKKVEKGKGFKDRAATAEYRAEQSAFAADEKWSELYKKETEYAVARSKHEDEAKALDEQDQKDKEASKARYEDEYKKAIERYSVPELQAAHDKMQEEENETSAYGRSTRTIKEEDPRRPLILQVVREKQREIERRYEAGAKDDILPTGPVKLKSPRTFSTLPKPVKQTIEGSEKLGAEVQRLKQTAKIPSEFTARVAPIEYADTRIFGGLGKLKEFIREVPEFAIDPTFTVSRPNPKDGEFMLVFQDGGRFKFVPEAIGIKFENPPENGQRIRIDLDAVDEASGKVMLIAEPTGEQPSANAKDEIERIALVAPGQKDGPLPDAVAKDREKGGSSSAPRNPERSRFYNVLEEKIEAIKSRRAQRQIPRGRGVGATTITSDIVDAAMIAALRAIQAGDIAGRALTKHVRAALADTNSKADPKAVRRVVKGMFRDAGANPSLEDIERAGAALYKQALGKPRKTKQVIAENAGPGEKEAPTLTRGEAEKIKYTYAAKAARQAARATVVSEAKRFREEVIPELRAKWSFKSMLQSLRGQGEAFKAGEREGWKRGKFSLAQQQAIRDTLVDAIRTSLPRSQHGKFIETIRDVNSYPKLRKALDRLERETVMYEGRQIAKQGGKDVRQKYLSALEPEELADVQAALVALKDAKRKLTPQGQVGLSIDELTEARDDLQAALNAVKGIIHASQQRDKVRIRGELVETNALRGEVIDSLGKRAELEKSETPGEREPSWVTRVGRRRTNWESLFRTIDNWRKGGVGGRMFQRVLAGRRASLKLHHDFTDKIGEIVTRNGYKSLGQFLAEVSGTLGPLAQKKIAFKIGGHDSITLGQAAYLYAAKSDAGFRRRVRSGQPLKFRDERVGGEPFKVTLRELDLLGTKIPANVRAIIDQAKAAYDKQYFAQLSAVNKRLKGFHLTKERGYWGIKLDRSETDTKGVPMSWRGNVIRAMEESGYMQERTGPSKSPILVGDFGIDILLRSKSSATVIGKAETTKALVRVFLHPETRRAMASTLGAESYERMERRISLYSGGDLFREANERIPRKILSLWARGKTQLWLPTWVRNMAGGIPRLMHELKITSIARGTLTPSWGAFEELRRYSPEARERWDSGGLGAFYHGSGLSESHARIGSSFKGTMRNLLTTAGAGLTGNLKKARDAARGAGKSWESLLDSLTIGNYFDATPAIIAYRHFIQKAPASYSAEAKKRWAAQHAMRAFERIANTATTEYANDIQLDARDSTLVASFVPFTGDTAKMQNMIYEAWHTGDTRAERLANKAKVVGIVGLSALMSAAVSALWSGALGDDRDKTKRTAAGRLAMELSGLMPIVGIPAANLLQRKISSNKPVTPEFDTPYTDLLDSLMSIGSNIYDGFDRWGEPQRKKALTAGDKFLRARGDSVELVFSGFGIPTQYYSAIKRAIKNWRE